MVDFFTNLWISFILGLATPLVAVCVLPLYPGFITFLTSKTNNKSPLFLGFLVVLGVMSSLFVIGLIFTALLEVSLTNVTGIISPIAFGILGLVSLALIFNIDIGRFFPRINAPTTQKPLLRAYLFGVFFGAIVLPCNPGPLIALFALSSTAMSFVNNFLNFIAFGLGIGLPLLFLAGVTTKWSSTIIGFLTSKKRIINVITGLIMLGISIYYLFFVFNII